MVKSIVASSATLSYALAIFYLSFVSAGTLGLIFKRMGIRGGVSLFHVLSFAMLAFLIRFMFSGLVLTSPSNNHRVYIQSGF